MNEQLRPRSLPVTTQAAEGLLRRRFTVAEIDRMVAAGIIAEDERIELIGGEVVPMSPKGRRHEIIRNQLAFRFSRQCPDTLRVASETPLELSPDGFAEPDVLVHPADIRLPDVRGDTVLLVVEVADSSLNYDLGSKAYLFASHGVRESWVINARTLETVVHRDPQGSTYANVERLSADLRLQPLLVPELGMALKDLGLDWGQA
jgi:Uma2 family endonuclease